ncbi:hypothetical protein GP486_003283 [Trichoglossum hirsutum]|uniref:Uncharacterized protein n=1 Tax=Trichoglossum hirsutum TaxID=265104 RepID=A0A9P8LDI5_9PEZI|nr:hypothetical protein GP486_003283 [Trichoglossum hirsutum]
MAIYNPTFIFGILVLLYLSSFILFAIIRILTGISIQRIGYCCLRRIAYTPKDGVKVEIRSLGFLLHRPTFAQPTWISVVLTELQVTLDLKEMDSESDGDALVNGATAVGDYADKTSTRGSETRTDELPEVKRRPELVRGATWERLVKAKEKVKRLHRLINWLRLVDVIATNSSFAVADVGCVQVGTFTMAVDTRQQTVDRGRLFQHRKVSRGGQRAAEWMFTLRSVLFTPEGKESLEILDHCTLNVHGLLHKERDGLRDAAVALKLGRVHIPYDDFAAYLSRLRRYQRSREGPWSKRDDVEISLMDVMEELKPPESREESIAKALSDSNEFASSILRGIKEVQFAVSFVGFSKELHSVQPSGSPLYLNVSMKEVGIDLHRLDPHTPAHRMYFAPNDIAHQALLAAISIAIGVDDGRGGMDRLIYLPMVTMTSKTTLPSKSLQVSEDRDAAERNANILFANMVFTSPSIDLKPKHLPLFLAFQHTVTRPATVSPKGNLGRSHIVSQLLPKSNIKLSVHEPVVRVVLPCMELEKKGTDDFDLLISSASSISLDIESSHSAAGDLHYSLASSFRISAHQLYYQTASGARHDLLLTETLELKVQLSASPEIHVVAAGNLQTFSVHMIRPEISQGVRQIVHQLKKYVGPERAGMDVGSQEHTFVRRVPSWLLQFTLEGRDFGVEVAGIDPDISEKTRGVALQLESWVAEYTAQRTESQRKPQPRRRAPSLSLVPDEPLLNTPSSRHKKLQNSTDGRRLAFNVRGLEGFIVESMDTWEPESFLSLPRFEVVFSTLSDPEGPTLHVSSHVKTLKLQYSLYRHYAIGVATLVLKEALVLTHKDVEDGRKARSLRRKFGGVNRLPIRILTDDLTESPVSAGEFVTLDVKASLVQIKATMPSDPPMMVQIYALDAGRGRWAAPHVSAKLSRLYAEAPKIKRVWARIVSIKNGRIDFREGRRRVGDNSYDERSIDFSSHCVRLAVPHQLVVHQVFDNLVNVAKSVQQLHHRFQTGTNEYILEKGPEGPKTIPKISLRSKALLFELEDSAFEWKLGTIYRLGLVEQKQRLAREEAFNVKAKKIEECEQRREAPRPRARSTHPRIGSQITDNTEQRPRSKSNEEQNRKQPPSRSSVGGRYRMRYDPDGFCGPSETSKISRDEALYRLQEYNSQSWKKVIDSSYAFQRSRLKVIRDYFWGPDELPDDVQEMETILTAPLRPGLMAALISDIHIVLDAPSFPIQDYSTFLHKIGKGMPRDMKYSLLIPLNIKVDMGEVRITLRDYPLPLIHVPSMRPSQFSRTPSLSLTTDFIVAEEFRDTQSTRIARIPIVPSDESHTRTGKSGFTIDVRRTVSPVKTYSDFSIDINTSYPTRITWGTSYQPAIQDMMLIIETFTKPQADPSDRIGFWDKIRLVFHSRFKVAWKGDGDVHLLLKGHGAGFAMCWRNDVRWNLCQDPDPRKFMTVDSSEFILAIPDFSHQARRSIEESGQDDESISSGSTSSYKNGALFKKVIMKLSGNVRWLAGLVFERSIDVSQRSFDFKPHYEVTLKSPECAVSPDGQYDAFRGFRSHFIHLSLSVVAPADRDWSVSNVMPSSSYNTVHLSPRFFTHFFNWWSLFSGAMSLPIRQGRLWPGIEKSSKKFGRHIATIKYSVLFSPLFMSHIYKHKDAEEYARGEDVVSATGLKVKLDSFMLDLHQRREEFLTQVKGRKEPTATSGMRINQTQLDFMSADIRAVSASIAGTTVDGLKRATEDTLASYQEIVSSVDMSRFTIPDNDFSWIDMDDFVELDWILPAEPNPETRIMPLAYAPRFTYSRQTDHSDSSSRETARMSPFGKEPSHFCIIPQDNDPRCVQFDLVRKRLQQLEEQIESHIRVVGEFELKIIKSPEDNVLKDHLELLNHSSSILRHKKDFLEAMLEQITKGLGTDSQLPTPSTCRNLDNNSPSQRSLNNPELEGIDSTPLADFVSDFNNRFIVHNMQMKWGNSLRNIILRYIHQVSQRRGFVYYMSRRAVKFILDIVEEQSKLSEPLCANSDANPIRPSEPVFFASSNGDQGSKIEDRIQQLLDDANKFVFADDRSTASGVPKATTDNLGENIAHEFTPQNSYHVRLIAPQIQLQSEKNAKAAVLLTAKGIQLKVVQIMDKDRVADDVSGLVQRRFSADMDGVQFFVTDRKSFSTQSVSLYSGNRYGAPAGSSWPPWVPLEVMFDFKTSPSGFSRVVQRTSASLRYDKYNSLRLKYNDEVTNPDAHQTKSPEDIESRIDHLWVEFPHIKAVCDSAQYYAIYIIVLDLLLYNEPLEKIRTERLEKIMLASDFSDLRGTPEMVIRLQSRIRQLEEIKTHFQINARYLDRQGWEQRLKMEQDLATCEDELFFMMKAITTSQRKYDERSQNNGLLKWWLSSREIVWHLMREDNEPLAELQLRNAAYSRTDNADGSNYNTMEVRNIRGLNLLSDAVYREMIAPYFGEARAVAEGSDAKMLKVNWNMLEAIAGIPVMDHFEVNLFPLKIQLEREVGKKLFEYIFPAFDPDASEDSSANTLEPDDDDLLDESLMSLDRAGPPSDSQEPSTRASSLELRLTPTMTLTDRRSITSSSSRTKSVPMLGLGIGESHHFRPFKTSTRTPSIRTPQKQKSNESLKMLSRKGTDRSITSLSVSSNITSEKPKKFSLHRLGSKDQGHAQSDDLTQMMSRASSYMTLAYVKVPSVVLCLSYKGKGERNFQDVHDFVFRMPILEYRNKTWSNLDLALQLKKDVVKALISHAGAIIGNKLSHHRPPKQQQQQQSRLREITYPGSPVLSSQGSPHDRSETTSIYASSIHASGTEDESSSLRQSFQSERYSAAGRTESLASSSRSENASLYGSESQPCDNTGIVGGEENLSFIHNAISRRFSQLSQKARQRDESPNDSEESLD